MPSNPVNPSSKPCDCYDKMTPEERTKWQAQLRTFYDQQLFQVYKHIEEFLIVQHRREDKAELITKLKTLLEYIDESRAGDRHLEVGNL